MERLKASIRSATQARHVTVNQRKLIDTMLARYAGDYATFRELIQNADDAESKTVVISLSCSTRKGKGPPAAGGRLRVRVDSIEVANDGKVFREEDWTRVQRISEGNPNEQCVGMFGVGFYSVFSFVDEPMICSGGKCMLFSWSGNQLTYHYSDDLHTKGERAQKTVFYFAPLKEAIVLDLEKLREFLKSSLSFTKHIKKIVVRNGEVEVLCCASKTFGAAEKVPVTRDGWGGADLFEPEGIEVRPCRVTVSGEGSVSEYDLVTSTLKLRRSPENVAFNEECRKILKKNLPKETKVSLLFPREVDRTGSDQRRYRGRIFVGLSTNEDTGCCFDISAHLYPTIERSNVDFQSPSLSKWNSQLTFAAGRCARAFYDWREGFSKPAYAPLYCWFPFAETKTQCVSGLLKDGFFQKPQLAISFDGKQMVPCKDLLLPKYKLETILSEDSHINLAPESSLKEGSGFFRVLEERKLARGLSHSDLVAHMNRNQPLSNTQAADILAWFVDGARHKDAFKGKKKEFVSAFRVAHPVIKAPLALKGMGFYADGALDGVPTPPNVLPGAVVAILGRITLPEKLSKVLGLKPLPFHKWVHAIAKGKAKPKAKPGSSQLVSWTGIQGQNRRALKRIHQYLSMNLTELQSLRAGSNILSQLKELPCMPTVRQGVLGFHKPVEAYFKPSIQGSSKNLNDFPYVDMDVSNGDQLVLLNEDESKGSRGSSSGRSIMIIDSDEGESDASDMESDLGEVHLPKSASTPRVSFKYLSMLDVQSHPHMEMLVREMIDQKATSLEIITSLSSGPTLSQKDIEELKKIPFIQCEDDPTLRCPGEILFRSQILDEVSSYFPPGHLHLLAWRPTKKHRDFLTLLGVQTFPRMNTIFEILGQMNQRIKDETESITEHPLMDFFLRNFDVHYEKFYAEAKTSCAFLPVVGETKMRTWAEASTSDGRPFLAMVSPEFLKKSEEYGVLSALELKELPTAEDVMNTILNGNALDEANIFAALTFLGKRMNTLADLKITHYRKLRTTPFIPHENGKYLSPGEVYLFSDAASTRELTGWITTKAFDGPARQFMIECGAKERPNASELVEAIMDPGRRASCIKSSSFSPDLYLQLLERIAAEWNTVGKRLRAKLRASKVLLASIGGGKEGVEMRMASECYLIDNTFYEALVKPCSSPKGASEMLEKMYEDLGSTWLTKAVTMKAVPYNIIKSSSSRAESLASLIEERIPLLLRHRDGSPITKLRADAEKVLTNLQVVEAKEIRRELSFEGKRIPLPLENADISMCTLDCPKEKRRRNRTLYLLQSADNCLFDIGSQLATLITTDLKNADQLGNQIAQILMLTHDQLSARGWPVGRFLPKERKRGSLGPVVMEEEGPQREFSFPIHSGRVKRVLKGCKNAGAWIAPDTGKRYTEEVSEPPVSSSSLKRTVVKVGGMACYVAEDNFFDEELEKIQPSGSSRAALESFVQILNRLASIVGVKASSCNVFLDRFSSALAFNLNKSLFFNLRSYEQLHFGKEDTQSVLMNWFVTMCHELAHNVHANHNKAHEQLEEELISNLMPSLFRSLVERKEDIVGGGAALPSSSRSRKRKKEPVVTGFSSQRVTRHRRKRRQEAEKSGDNDDDNIVDLT